MEDQAVYWISVVEVQVDHTMYLHRYIEAGANSVEKTRSYLNIGASQLFVVPTELDNMKMMWTGERNPMPSTSILDFSTQVRQEGLRTLISK